MRFDRLSFHGLATCSTLAVALAAGNHNVAFSQEDSAVTITDDPTAGITEGATGEGEQATAQEVLEKGQKALQEGDFATALEAFDQLAKAGERDVSQQAFQLRLIGYAGRGAALAGMKEYEAAIEEFKLALDLDENFIPVLLSRGQMYLDLGVPDNYPVALADFQRAMKAQRNNPQALFGLGKALVLVGHYQAAVGPLTRYIEIDPNNPEAYRLRGTAYSNIFKVPESIEDLNKSIELNPDDHETYLTLGSIDYRNEKYQDAIDQFKKALETYKPKDPEDKLPFIQGHLTLASLYLELAKTLKDEKARNAAYDSAIEQTETVLSKVDTKNPYHAGIRASSLYTRALAERMKGDLLKAVQTFSEAIEINPDFSEAYYRRGICYHYLGDDKLAITDFNEAANINFSDPRASLWQGFTHAKMGDFQDALRAYGNALAASDRYTPAYLNRGLAYMALGEYDKALTDFNDAVRLEPTNSDYYFKRGLAYEALRNAEKAVDSFQAAIRFNDKNAAAYRHLADSMQQLGHNDQAVEYRQRANELEPPKASSQN